MKELKDLKLQEISKLREMDEKSLKAELISASKNLYTLTMKLELGELKQSHLIKALRRYVAQIKTVANTKGFNVG
jgi:large subunit ribosomal protein L29